MQLSFTIIPVLGRKTNVPSNDPSLFKFVAEGIALTHDTGGLNFDLRRKVNTCTKSYGSVKWSASATSQATKCLGLFELYNGTNRDHIIFDNGVCYVYDSNLAPQAVYDAKLSYDNQTGDFTVGLTITGATSGATAVIARDDDDGTSGTLYLQNVSGTFQDNETITDTGVGSATVDGTVQQTTFATNNSDLYSIIRVGDYMVFTDNGNTTPYKWKNGDTNLTPLIASGTAYKFKWLLSFQRRVIGLYSDQDDGNIEIRWSSDWPVTAISSLNFPSGNQLYIPNDDPIVGGATMGLDGCYIYCENSINQLLYYPDYTNPFRLHTTISSQGAANHHSIVSLGDRHFLFNRNYGFCEYRGGAQFPYGGKPVSEDIDTEVSNISPNFYDLIVGCFFPNSRKIAWVIPTNKGNVPTQIWFYNVDTGQWEFEDKAERFIDVWTIYTTYTWNDLINDLESEGYTTPTWNDILSWKGSSTTWSDLTNFRRAFVYSNTDGHLYYHSGDSIDGDDLDGYRVEPIIDFGDAQRKDTLQEIWFDIAESGSFSIDVYYRGGDTVGEVEDLSWTSLGSISCDDNSKPVLYVNQTARLHQIKWGTNAADEKFSISRITFKYMTQGVN